MKLNLRFFVSWLFSALCMFLLFYLWHGVFLNDFQRLNFPLSWFVSFAAVTYLLFSAGIYALFESSLMGKIRNVMLRGLICGSIAGFTLFMIATIINISFTKHLSVQHLMMDCVWQITEQSFGALVIVICKGFIHDHQTESI
jgi:hypothetical protein